MDRIIPEAFIEKYAEILPIEELEAFLEASCRPLRKSIRVNTLKISVEEFVEKTKKMGWELTPIPWCTSGFWIDREDRSQPLGKSYLHLAGYFYIQEASSMMPPEVLDIKEDDIVLDVASAPGSKTTQMAAMMNNKGTVVANELETSRIKAMASNLERLGVANVLFTNKDGRAFSQYFPNFFDKILLDAPCGGEGTVRKDKGALEFWNQKGVEKMAALQWTMIEEAFRALKPGGEMVYSTCTLAPEENEMILLELLERFPGNAEIVPINETFIQNPEQYGLTQEEVDMEVQGMGVEGVVRVWPHSFDTEGFFVSKIRKNHPTEDSDFQKNRRNSPYSQLSKKSKQWLDKEFNRMFGFTLEDTSLLQERGNEIWVRPKHAETIAQMMSFDRAGMLLCERHRDEMKLTHEGALYLIQAGCEPQQGVVELSEEECKTFFQGLDIRKECVTKQYVYLKHNGVYLGIAKAMGNKLKNQLPRYFAVSS